MKWASAVEPTRQLSDPDQAETRPAETRPDRIDQTGPDSILCWIPAAVVEIPQIAKCQMPNAQACSWSGANQNLLEVICLDLVSPPKINDRLEGVGCYLSHQMLTA